MLVHERHTTFSVHIHKPTAEALQDSECLLCLKVQDGEEH